MNEEEKYLFDLQGYVTVPNALTPEQIAGLNTILDEKIQTEVALDETSHRFGGLLKWGKEYIDLIDNARTLPQLKTVIGSRPRLDHVYLDIIRGGLSPIGASLHGGGNRFDFCQYYRYADGQMYNGLTVVAYNLHDVNPGDGGFGCIPGSHKANFSLPQGWGDLEHPQDIVRAVTGPAGTAIIFTEALTHGAMPWKGARDRRTIFFKYCPAPTAYSGSYFNADEYADLTESQRDILSSPRIGGSRK
jgi:hypothetical protein